MFCAARRKTRAKRAEIRSAQQKRPCQPKTAKRFFGGPASQGPSGQAKEQTRILPVRRVFSAPGVPRRLPGLAVLALPAAVVGGLCVRCSGAFSAGVLLACFRPAGCPPFFVWPALPACRLAVVGFVSGLQAACRFCANFCARCPFARRALCVCAFSFIFRFFLPNFCLSKIFSLVAQAATGLYFLPKRK